MLACLYIPWRNSKTTIYCNFPSQRSLAGVSASQGEPYLSPSPAACCAQPDVTRQAVPLCRELNGILLQLLTCLPSLAEFRYTHSSPNPQERQSSLLQLQSGQQRAFQFCQPAGFYPHACAAPHQTQKHVCILTPAHSRSVFWQRSMEIPIYP